MTDTFQWNCPKHTAEVKGPFEVQQEGNISFFNLTGEVS